MFTHTHARRIAAALGACALALPLHAQQRTADDPQAAVPATRYQPAWEPPATPPDSTTPDRSWRALNRTVAENADPHASHGRHGHHAAPVDKKAPDPGPHTGHHGHTSQPAAREQHHHGEHH